MNQRINLTPAEASAARPAGVAAGIQYQANVSLWLNCNLKCPYCFANPIAAPKQWPSEIEERLALFENFLASTGRWSLDFSGGEVAIYPGFAALCERLAAAGHEVNFFTNGTVPLAELFTPERIGDVNRVTLSYQVPHEKVERYERIFDDNIAFLLEHGVEVAVNYVLYPNRKATPEEIRERFDREGVELQYRPFQGEYNKQQYPFSYTAEEKARFAEFGDLRANFLMEHSYYVPTLKKCQAGSSMFYISYRTGGVYICEQLQHRELANFAEAGAAEAFRTHIAPEPQVCMAKRCTCRLTMDQEAFLAKNDVWDMSLYPEWEKLSLPTDEAVAYWQRVEKAFADEVAERISGDNVYIWGAGVHCLMMLKLFHEQGFPLHRIQGIIDSNSLKYGGQLMGLPILSREKFEQRAGDTCSTILISSRAFEEEIAQGIELRYGQRYPVVRLYDGSMKNHYEALDGVFQF